MIVLGKACYAIEELCHPVKTEQQMSEVINQLSSWKLDIDLVENFLAYLTSEYCIPTSWRNPDRKHVDGLQKKIKAI